MDKYILHKDGVLEKESVNRVRTDYPRINEAELIDDYYSQDDFHNKLAYTFLMELHNREEA